MARARNIKPGFFENEDLADCGLEAMLLFAGLWTLADREGRLEDRPRRIKAKLFAYFDLDVDAALEALAARGFVQRYTCEGSPYIQVTNFGKHQSPHIKETPSTIPAPGQPGTSTGQDENVMRAAPPDSLIPDSRNAESLKPELPAGESARTRATPPLPGPNVRSFVPHAGKTQMPEDWEPSDEDRAFARQHGMGGREIAHNAVKCRAHYRAHGELRENWSEAWRLWVLREIEGGPGAPRLPPLPPEDMPPLTEEERAADAANRAELERQRQQRFANEPSAHERMLNKARDDPDRPDHILPEQWMHYDNAQKRANSPAMRKRLSK